MESSNLVVAQGGGPTMAMNSSLIGVVEEALAEDEIDGVYGARNGLEGLCGGELVDLGRESRQTLESVATAPGAALGSSRARLSDEEYDRVFDVCRSYGIRHFLYIGGDGTMTACHRVHEHERRRKSGLRVVGIPKTVDNDLQGTDHCPGYGSAARYYAVAVRELAADVESLPTPVSVFETMGRTTGWLAASTALARRPGQTAPHLIYLPERPLRIPRFLEDVQKVYDEFGWVVAVVSEGVVDESETAISIARGGAHTDDFGRGLPGGAGAALARLIGEELNLRARSEKPGLLARASEAHASETDRREARMLGRDAVRRAARGPSGIMVALTREDTEGYSCSTAAVRLADVAGGRRPVPPHFIHTGRSAMTEAFIDYAEPLIGRPLPRHPRLDAHPVDV